MSKYQIPVNYTFYGTIDIEANNFDDALEIAENMIEQNNLSLVKIDVTSESVEIADSDLHLFDC